MMMEWNVVKVVLKSDLKEMKMTYALLNLW